MKDPHQINTVEELRKIIVCSEKQTQSLKDRLYDYMDDIAQDFIRSSPVIFFAT